VLDALDALDASNTPIPAYGEDLVTVVGHRYDESRFVPVGQDPDSVPGVVTTTSP
jgi:hypothetical protein